MTSTSDEVGHTATPWFVSGSEGHETQNDQWYPWRTIGSEPDGTRICDLTPIRREELNKANAAFIVSAVNSHDSLVKALEEIANHPTGGVGCNPVSFVETARAALSQAKGGK